MRLYLSSYGLGDHPEHLLDLLDGRQGLVVLNALDGADPARRSEQCEQQRAALAGLGLSSTELDLRLPGSDELAEALDAADFLWVRGGNVFTLRMAMARSGLDRLLLDRLAADTLVYAGFSAGPCVLAPSLRGLEHCDPVDDALRLHGEVRYDGLGVLDRPVVPHLDSPGHPETELLGEVARRHRAAGQEFWGLRDGQALVVDGESVEIV